MLKYNKEQDNILLEKQETDGHETQERRHEEVANRQNASCGTTPPPTPHYTACSSEKSLVLDAKADPNRIEPLDALPRALVLDTINDNQDETVGPPSCAVLKIPHKQSKAIWYYD